MMTRKERRRASRTFSSVPLDLCDPKSQAIIGEGRFINVSLTGSQVESRKPFPLHKQIQLRVQTPGHSGFEFAGRIVWRKRNSSGFSYGIKFKPFSAKHIHLQPIAFKEVA
jgi:hypothetical protein